MKLTGFLTAAVFAVALVSGCSESTTSTAATTPTSAAVLSSSGSSARDQLNAIRASAGQAGATRNATLDAIARGHATDMARRNFFAHRGSDGSNVGQRAKRGGYRWCFVAENIAMGYRSQSAAIESWRTSPGHYRNLVSSHAKEFGMANVGKYWVMVLAAKRC